MRLSTYEIILPLIGTDEKQIEGCALLVKYAWMPALEN